MGRQISVREIATVLGAGGVYRALGRARWVAASEAIARETLYAGNPDQPFGPSTYAQFGEDMIIINVFYLLGIERPTYLDVGGHHPFHGSNTALFYRRGSRGVVIEANPSLIDVYRAGRPEDTIVNVGVAARRGTLTYYRFDDFSGRNTFSKEVADAFAAQYPQFRVRDTLEIEVLTLKDVVDRYCGGKFPDFMSIDVEGLDVEILESFDFSTRPTGDLCRVHQRCRQRCRCFDHRGAEETWICSLRAHAGQWDFRHRGCRHPAERASLTNSFEPRVPFLAPACRWRGHFLSSWVLFGA